MQNLLRSKLFYAFLAGKLIFSVVFFTTLLPTEAKTMAVETVKKTALACSAQKSTVFAPAKGLEFPVGFTLPQGWSAVWHNRGGACAGSACVASTIELNPGYVYDADRGAIRQGAAIQLSLIKVSSTNGRAEEVIRMLMDHVQITNIKTMMINERVVTTYEGEISTLNQKIPSRDYVVSLDKQKLHISIEAVTPENEQAVQSILNSLEKRS